MDNTNKTGMEIIPAVGHDIEEVRQLIEALRTRGFEILPSLANAEEGASTYAIALSAKEKKAMLDEKGLATLNWTMEHGPILPVATVLAHLDAILEGDEAFYASLAK